MGSTKDNLVLEKFFVFIEKDKGSKTYHPESLVWAKYAEPIPHRVHEIGKDIQAIKRIKRPDTLYIGFVNSLVEKIHAYKNRNQHGFKIYDAPSEEEGEHHVEVALDLVENVSLKQGERDELTIALAKLFTDFVSQQ